MEQFLGGLQVLLQWQNFLIIPVGLAIGIIGCYPRTDLRFRSHPLYTLDLWHGSHDGYFNAAGHLLRRYLRRFHHCDSHQHPGYLGQCGNAV